MSEQTYTVGQVARLAGVTVRTPHHDDEIGLLTRIDRLRAAAATLARTVEAHEMGINLTPEEMLEVFGDHDPTEHVEEAKARWGDTDAYRESHRRASSYTKDDWLQIRREGDEVPAAFAAAKRAGLPADSPEAAAAAVAHREHITRWFYAVTPEVHQGLAQMYVSDERFAATYDAVEPGLAQYVSDAILAVYR